MMRASVFRFSPLLLLAAGIMALAVFFVVHDARPAQAQSDPNAGKLDLGFSAASKITTDVSAGTDQGYAMAVQSDGKIVVVGSSHNGTNLDFAVVRYTADGLLDTTFSLDGKVTTDINSNDDIAYAVAIDSNGKIVVAGAAGNGSNKDFAVVRYTSTGVLDTDFSGDGKVFTAIGSGADEIRAMKIDSNGKIVVAGFSAGSSSGEDFALARYTTAGALDTTFGTVVSGQTRSGKVTTAMASGSGKDQAHAVALQGNGRIVAAGRAGNDFALARYTTAGVLDTSFSTDGKVTTDVNSNDDAAYAVAVQSDGKIVVAGEAGNGSNKDFAVVRYTATGGLDTSFHEDGKQVTAIGSDGDHGRAMEILSDGKILVGGYRAKDTFEDFALARYNANGSLDIGFGSGGKVVTSIGINHDRGHALALDADGNILLAGSSVVVSNFQYAFALAAYRPGGAPAVILDGPGWLATEFGTAGEDNKARAVAVHSNGKIVTAGQSHNGSNYDFAVARYNADGSPDTSFGGDGKVTTAVGTGRDEAYAVAVQPNGKIVAAGRSSDDFALVRYNNDGSLDTSFGNGGKVVTGNTDTILALALQRDGKIVAAGRRYDGNDYNFQLARYNADGSLDTSFGGDGKVTTEISSGHDVIYAVKLERFGKIVAAGYAVGSARDFALARYNADGSLDTSFSGDGKVVTSFTSANDFAYGVALQRDGRIVAAGSAADDFALARYNPDGSLDTSFGSGGKVTTDFDSRHDAAEGGMVLQRDDKIVLAGITNSTLGQHFALARYNADGSLDTDFGDGGKVTTLELGRRAGALAVARQGDKIVLAGNSIDEFGMARYLPGPISPVQARVPGLGSLSDRSSPFWSALLTEPIGGGTGCGNREDYENCILALSNNHVQWYGQSYRITQLRVRFGILALEFDKTPPPEFLRHLTLNINGRGFNFENAGPAGPGLLHWHNTGVSWGDGDVFRVGLERRSSYGCEDGGSVDASLNPTDLRAIGGDGVLTLAWLDPDTDQNYARLVRWRRQNTPPWLNPQGALGEADLFPKTPTFDATGLEGGTTYEAQVRIVLRSRTTPAGIYAIPCQQSQWVSVTGTTLAAAHAQIWSATLNPVALSGSYHGCENVNADSAKRCSTQARLDDAMFNYGGTTYTVHEIYAHSDGDELVFAVSAAQAANSLIGLDLRVDGSTFPFADASFDSDIARWRNHGLSSWSAGTPVQLSLVESPVPTEITVTASGALHEGGPPVNVFLNLDRPALAEGGATLGTGDNNPATYPWIPDIAQGATVSVMQISVPEDTIDNNCRKVAYGVAFEAPVAGGEHLYTDFAFTVVDNDGTADTCTGELSSSSSPSQNSPCANCGTGGDTGAVTQGQAQYADLIARMKEWRNDPQWVSQKAHTDRWDRALLAFGETVADATLTPMTAAEAQALADQSWGARWVPVAKALWELQNRAPTVSGAISDVTIVNDIGTREVSLAGVFHDPDGDSLTISAVSSDEATATASAAADGSTLTVTARLRGTAVITVTADDGKGGTVDDSFTVTVKAAPDVASDIADVSGLEAGSTREVSLSGVFRDADGDALTVTASSDDDTIATVSVASDGSTLTVTGVAEGTATVTVIAQDSDGNRVMDDFDVAVVAQQQQQQQQQPANQAPTVSSGIGDATIVNESGTHAVSLSGVFSDADNDALTISAASDDEAAATVSVASDYSSLTVNAQARGTATITVTAADGRGGTVSDSFTVTVKAAPVVASAIADLSGMEVADSQDIALSGVFSDADGDTLTFTADPSDFEVANAFLSHGTLTVFATGEGTATITVTAEDSDGNSVSDAFDVSVAAPQPATPNQAPTVSNAIGDATIVNESSAHTVSLAGVFDDADGDSLTVSAASSDEAKATVSVAADYSGLTVNAQARGTATITFTADDGNGGTVSDSFIVTVKAAPVVASAIADVSGLETEDAREVSLSGVFSDADGDPLTISASSSDNAIATVSVAADHSALTVTGVSEGSATVTVTAQDSDGNRVSDTFDVTVAEAETQGDGPPTPVSNLSCDARTDRVTFRWDAPEWSGGKLHAYDYVAGLPDGRWKLVRLQGDPVVSEPGDYQAGKEARITIGAVYKLADGSEVSSALETLTCTVAE